MEAEGQPETLPSLNLSFPLWPVGGSEAVLPKDSFPSVGLEVWHLCLPWRGSETKRALF